MTLFLSNLCKNEIKSKNTSRTWHFMQIYNSSNFALKKIASRLGKFFSIVWCSNSLQSSWHVKMINYKVFPSNQRPQFSNSSHLITMGDNILTTTLHSAQKGQGSWNHLKCECGKLCLKRRVGVTKSNYR